MNTLHSTPILMLVLSVLVAPALVMPALAGTEASALSAPQSMNEHGPCKTLMTELECSLHKTTLAQLNHGPTRDRYLAEYAQMMQERESSCSCNRKVTAATVYPTRRQALLRF